MSQWHILSLVFFYLLHFFFLLHLHGELTQQPLISLHYSLHHQNYHLLIRLTFLFLLLFVLFFFKSKEPKKYFLLPNTGLELRFVLVYLDHQISWAGIPCLCILGLETASRMLWSIQKSLKSYMFKSNRVLVVCLLFVVHRGVSHGRQVAHCSWKVSFIIMVLFTDTCYFIWWVRLLMENHSHR